MGRAPCCDKTKVKRGPWSPDEDATLKTYLQIHGTGGNWITLPLKAGLKRCGKSCRLRWLNYLRPDIKHGGFTQEEDNIIFTLHSQMGSRWSLIASHLPGRTDNDVKNYWNTKLKKKLLLYRGKTSPQITNTSTNKIISPINNNTISCSKPFMPCVPKFEPNSDNLFSFWDSMTQNSDTLPVLSDNISNCEPLTALSLDPAQILSCPSVIMEPGSNLISSLIHNSSSQQGSSVSDSSTKQLNPLASNGHNYKVDEDRILMEYGFSNFRDNYYGIFSEDKASEITSNWYPKLEGCFGYGDIKQQGQNNSVFD